MIKSPMQTLETGTKQIADYTPERVDSIALRGYRLRRLQEQLVAADCAAALLIDPVNIVYATGSRSMTVWLLHNLGRYCVVPARGLAVMFEFPNGNCLRLSRGLETVAEVRPAHSHSNLMAGEHAPAVAALWAAEIADLLQRIGGRGSRLAVDRVDHLGALALAAAGVDIINGQPLAERARSVKSAEEMICMRQSVAAADAGMARMRETLRPGITENQLWAELHYTNIALGGEWIETRLLSSGPRTNPWYQESSDRVIAAGELVSFDTDMIGPHGYCADVSRAFHCGPGVPTVAQRQLYTLAAEQIAHNCALVRPGVSFREVVQKAWKIPERFQAQQYGVVAHGVGMVDEWPIIGYNIDDPFLQAGVLEPGMTICVESYIGEVGGSEGVKLEQQVLVTPSGCEILSKFPLDAGLLA